MLSGRPVLVYKLDGISDEYDQYLYYINGNQLKDMANSIINIYESLKVSLIILEGKLGVL
jgi:hypothetical protein